MYCPPRSAPGSRRRGGDRRPLPRGHRAVRRPRGLHSQQPADRPRPGGGGGPHGLFSAFDELAQRYGLEKIKTIGDAYMVAGGLPKPRPDHAQAIAELALAMQAEVTRRTDPSGQPLAVRIGIDTGPVEAGVIGTAKFSYDLWGDTVNTASRMESHGVPGCIQVTARTYQRLQDDYQFQRRGPISIRGMGEMVTWFLVGRNQ